MNKNRDYEAVLIGFGAHGIPLYYFLTETFNSILIVEKAPLNNIEIDQIRRDDEVISDDVFEASDNIDAKVFIGVGLVNKFATRKKIFEFCVASGCVLPPFIHRHSYIESSSVVKSSAFIGPNVYLNHGTVIGENSIVNSSASVDHDVVIGENCFVGPGTIICGGVSIGRNVLIGAGSIIRDNVSLPDGTIFPMGSKI